MNWNGFATSKNDQISIEWFLKEISDTGETAAENSALLFQEEITFEKIYKLFTVLLFVLYFYHINAVL